MPARSPSLIAVLLAVSCLVVACTDDSAFTDGQASGTATAQGLYLAADADISEFTLSSTSDPGVAVFAELPMRDGVQLGSAPTDFGWSPS